ncbi:hypothetical protein NM208_g11696 [Fusarium decemcellulare]|uniref:Uncharacterized protein n=1 Tax=Fusarium decemcellulare TaxID=57161 RepID=A0ACC1RU00_9HYPO|nr:hypothetical protein NM208_g11696 [Fusarium decemcellulare]
MDRVLFSWNRTNTHSLAVPAMPQYRGRRFTPSVQAPIEASSYLCVICENLFRGKPRWGWGQDRSHHKTERGLAMAANAGCYICRSIVDSGFFERHSEVDLLCHLMVYENRHPGTFGCSFSNRGQYVCFVFGIPLKREMTLTSRPRLLTTLPCGSWPRNGLSDAQLQPVIPTAHALWETFEVFLSPIPFRPTRLIQIIDDERAKLVLSSAHPERVPYVALSHRWGTAETARLLTNNIDQLCNGFEIGNLPPSYKEAISACRKLNFEYIWIDSLCIIQDSEDNSDWQREAMMMKSIYAHCTLNLCATGAADSSQSCFQKRNAASIKPFQVTPQWHHWKGKKVLAYVGPDFDDDILSSPLSSRAWVFQETHLSGRSLVMGSHQLWWYCRQNLACESFPKGGPEMRGTPWLPGVRRMKDNESPRTHATEPATGWSAWQFQTKCYAKTRLTHESERTIAFSGFAQAFGESYGLNEHYLAGFWRSHLPLALLWRCESESKTQRSPDYKAPSWSWFSLDGPFEMTGLESISNETLCSVELVSLRYVDETQPMGLLKGGAIKLRGHLVGPHTVNADGTVPYYDLQVTPGVDDSEKIEKAIMYMDERDVAGEQMISYLDNLDEISVLLEGGLMDGASRTAMPLKQAQGNIFYLPLSKVLSQLHKRRRSLQMVVQGLILYQPVHQPTLFHRIGMYSSRAIHNENYHHELETGFPEQSIMIL